MSVTLGVKVDYEAYKFYRYDMPERERDRIRQILRKTFTNLIEEYKKRQGLPEEQKERDKEEIEVRVTQTFEIPESEVIRLYKRLQGLEKDLTRAVANLEETKELLEKERSEREKCVQELEQIKKKPDELAKQVAELRKELEGYQLVFSVLKYCLESGECDPVKLNDYLRPRLSRIQLQKPPEPTLAIVRRSPK